MTKNKAVLIHPSF